MKKFFKTTLAFTLGFIIAINILFFGSLLILKAKSNFSKYIPKSNDILLINLKGKMYEDTPPKSLLDKRNSKISFKKIIQSIKFAKEDPKIKGIRIDIENFQAGWAMLEEIRKQLIDFKKSKKILLAYAYLITNKSFYLTSMADKIILHPEGMFIWPGIGVRYLYYKNMLKRLRISPVEFHKGEYKSYGEKFYRSNMSKYSRKQTKELLDSIYNELLDTTSRDRSISKIKLKNLATNLNIKVAKNALDNNLIDILGYYDDADDYLKQKLDIKKDKEISYANLNEYYLYKESKISKNNNQVAVLIAEGQIMYSKSRYGEVIGSKDMIKTIKKIRKDKKIKSVVLRINSPGGSVLASDEIWHELMLLKKEKPLIASMSDVAASGGYYIASAADYILADKNTITGSIGVLAVMFNTGRLFREYLGITNSTVNTEPHADVFSDYMFGLQRNLKPKERSFIQTIIETHYKGFITKVAASRKMKVEKIDSLGRGRVWIGEAAKNHNLVDQIGTLEDAIKIAAQKAKIKDKYSVCYWPKKKMFFEMIFESSFEKISDKLLFNTIGENYKYFKKAKHFSKMKGIQAIMPYDIEIN